MIKQVSQILGPTFDIEYSSRFRKYLVFSADDKSISDADISNLIAELIANGYFPQIQRRNGRFIVHIVPKVLTQKKPRIWINIVLFIATIITTMMAGAFMVAGDIENIWAFLFSGWRYSFAVLTILTMHEMGHYFAARFHKMNVTLPYYIPLPIPGFHFGTLGAFIKIKSPIPNRRALLDTAVSGPLAGFFASLIFLIIGYIQLPDWQGIVAYIETIHPLNLPEGQGINIILGKSILFAFFNDVIAGGRLPMNEVYHFPFIFAGWIGLLVTAINLIPIGQLDGGHVLYALFRKKARTVGILFFIMLIILNFILIVEYFSFVWVLWIILIMLLIGFRHPPTMRDDIPLTKGRTVLGWVCLAILVLCFMPLPLYIG